MSKREQVVLDLRNLPEVDPLHDFLVTDWQLSETKFVLNYQNLAFYETDYEQPSDYYQRHKNHTACQMTFQQLDLNGQVLADYLADSKVVVIGNKKAKLRGRIFELQEFLTWLTKKELTLQTLSLVVGYGEICLQGEICHKKDGQTTFKQCQLWLEANQITYDWS